MTISTPPSADDVERAREIEKCDSGRTHCFVWLDSKKLCSKCEKIVAALTAAREQGEARGRAEGARQMRERAALMIAPKCNCGCIDTDLECVKCAVLKRVAASALADSAEKEGQA